MLIHYAGEEVFDIFETFNTEQKGSEDNEGYQVLCDSLTKHFQPRKNIDFERYRFRLARQEPNESMMSFYTRLRKLAKYCEFSNLDLEIKGQIIQGCTSQGLRRRGLRDEMTLSKLLETAYILEQCEQQAQEMESKFGQAEMSLHAVRRKSDPVNATRPRNSPCHWCGGPKHTRSNCPSREKQCYLCSKTGHFSKVCQSTRPSQTARILYEEPTDNTQQAIDYTENELFTISSNEIVSGVSREIKTPTIPKVTVNVLGTPVEFFIDTGSSVNVIDDATFKRISHSSSVSTRLSPTAAKIFAYGTTSPLQVLGQITCPISFQHTETTALFYVTRPQPSSKGGNLINSETAQKLQVIKLLFEHSDPITQLIC